MATLFESVPCTRCGGSGHYSYCQMYGDTCFKCAGTGRQLTKRGRAAADYLRQLRTVKVECVKLGDCVRVDGVPGFSRSTYIRVEQLYTQLDAGSSTVNGETKHYHSLHLCGKTPKGEDYSLGTLPEGEVRLVPSKADAQKQVAAALAYQATLTGSGTVAKRRAS